MFDHGVKLLDEGNPEAAIREFQRALANASTPAQKADLFYNIAVCHVRLGSVDAAVEAVAEALAADPDLVKEFRTDQDFAPIWSNASFREALQREHGLNTPLECPRCGLVSPAGAVKCDCGYDFTKSVEAGVRRHKPSLRTASWVLSVIIVGVAFRQFADRWPGARDGLWLGPLMFVLVEPVVETYLEHVVTSIRRSLHGKASN